MKNLFIILFILFIGCKEIDNTTINKINEVDAKLDSTTTKTNLRLDSLGIAINNNISDLELAIDEFNNYIILALDDLLKQDTIYNTVYIPVPIDSLYTNPVPIDSVYNVYKFRITFKVESLDSIEYGEKGISVSWDHNIEPDLLRYTVYIRNTMDIPCDTIPVDTNYIEITLPDTGSYFIYCTASDSSLNESPPSNEVEYRCIK